jgi:deazaflavin-dependent oxidoreductase (nitroreductase family)
MSLPLSPSAACWATSNEVGLSGICGQTDGHQLGAREDDGMRLVAKAVLWLHSTLYRLTNGRIGGRFIAGSPILLLTTIGRRTGKQRTRPLAYIRDGDRFVLCASNGGSPRHPGWYHNLRAAGRAEIQVGAEHLAVSARTADPSERSQLFPRFVQMYKGYAGYEQKTSRQIPLVLLTPDHRPKMT